jgi:hypothetical protein
MKHLPASTLSIIAACLLSVASNARQVEAQTIQLPVVHSIGGQVNVMVPDRGGIFLGGIGRAGSSRSSYGFGPFRGSSVGRYTEHIGISSHVYIMDLQAMDRQILDMANSCSCDNSYSRSGIAFTDFNRSGPAFQAVTPARRYFGLSNGGLNNGGLNNSGRIISSFYSSTISTNSIAAPLPARTTSSRETPKPRRSRALDPDHAWQLGQEAEQDGKMIVAKLHYQTAAQYGSVEARQRLIELGEKPVALQQ